MSKSEMAAKMNEGGAWLPGKRVKLDFGDQGSVMLDGVANQVTEEDGAADTTIKVAWADWEDMVGGKRANGKRRNEFLCPRRHDRPYRCAALTQPPNEIEALVSRDAAGNDEEYALSRENHGLNPSPAGPDSSLSLWRTTCNQASLS